MNQNYMSADPSVIAALKIQNCYKCKQYMTYNSHIYVMYKLRFCNSCNLYKKSVQVATCTNSIYKLQLVQVELYKLQHVQISNLYKLQLVQAPYLLFEHCILINLNFKFYEINSSHLHE